ncbi:MAG: macrolide ABC transporter ATP-binding protein [Desulfobacteraceae bacterium 4572_35.2]|nr:MAG: macrolide ABC transporter ATP-binding protein [Desulfobacteraceae bacterium 4572_35.2]
MIVLQQVSRCYGAGDSLISALNNVDLSIESGKTVAILGRSGSGKSTLLNVIGCLDPISAGTYQLNDQDVSKLDDDALSILRLESFGFIFQSFHLIPQLNVLENIELPLYYLGVEAKLARERAKSLAAIMSLDDRWLHRPAQLSGGQQQRVAIARALVNDPAILLADEPTGNLDAATGSQILSVLHRLADEGKTVVTVTHDQSVAYTMDRRLYMLDGRIVRTDESRNEARTSEINVGDFSC